MSKFQLSLCIRPIHIVPKWFLSNFQDVFSSSSPFSYIANLRSAGGHDFVMLWDRIGFDFVMSMGKYWNSSDSENTRDIRLLPSFLCFNTSKCNKTRRSFFFVWCACPSVESNKVNLGQVTFLLITCHKIKIDFQNGTIVFLLNSRVEWYAT